MKSIPELKLITSKKLETCLNEGNSTINSRGFINIVSSNIKKALLNLDKTSQVSFELRKRKPYFANEQQSLNEILDSSKFCPEEKLLSSEGAGLSFFMWRHTEDNLPALKKNLELQLAKSGCKKIVIASEFYSVAAKNDLSYEYKSKLFTFIINAPLKQAKKAIYLLENEKTFANFWLDQIKSIRSILYPDESSYALDIGPQDKLKFHQEGDNLLDLDLNLAKEKIFFEYKFIDTPSNHQVAFDKTLEDQEYINRKVFEKFFALNPSGFIKSNHLTAEDKFSNKILDSIKDLHLSKIKSSGLAFSKYRNPRMVSQINNLYSKLDKAEKSVVLLGAKHVDIPAKIRSYSSKRIPIHFDRLPAMLKNQLPPSVNFSPHFTCLEIAEIKLGAGYEISNSEAIRALTYDLIQGTICEKADDESVKQFTKLKIMPFFIDTLVQASSDSEINELLDYCMKHSYLAYISNNDKITFGDCRNQAVINWLENHFGFDKKQNDHKQNFVPLLESVMRKYWQVDIN